MIQLGCKTVGGNNRNVIRNQNMPRYDYQLAELVARQMVAMYVYLTEAGKSLESSNSWRRVAWKVLT